MSKYLSIVGLLLTSIYGVCLYFLTKDRLPELQHMPLNEVGDFLAGAFGPLAIFWLILGFMQQGKELFQNTKALELQAKELKSAVDQQRELVGIAKKQYQSDESIRVKQKFDERRSRRPSFMLLGFGGMHSDVHKFTCNIINTGAKITNVVFTFDVDVLNMKNDKKPVWETDETVRLEFEFKSNMPPDECVLKMKYIEGNRRRREVSYKINSKIGDSNLPELYLNE